VVPLKDNQSKKKPYRKSPVWLSSLICIYVVFLASLTAINQYGPDRWWFGDVNLFLPQVIWMIPGVVLAFLSLAIARHWVWVPVLCLLWVLGPIMGFCWRLESSTGSAEGLNPVRVMTCNVKYGKRDISALVDDIIRHAPDIVILQDADFEILEKTLGKLFMQWNVRYRPDGKYIVASRFPLDTATVSLVPYQGESHTCLRCQVHIGPTTVTLFDVHFVSPRQGLYEFTSARRQPDSFPMAIRNLKKNQEDRLSQALALRDLVRSEQGPVIVAGDLNSSDASLVCKTLREAGLHDSFAEGGRGYGYTYGHFLLRNKHPWFRRSWMRIDHIMISSHLESMHCWTGSGQASDHRPVFADLIIKQ
jgi:vancomycin resistance protein VanJ